MTSHSKVPTVPIDLAEIKADLDALTMAVYAHNARPWSADRTMVTLSKLVAEVERLRAETEWRSDEPPKEDLVLIRRRISKYVECGRVRRTWRTLDGGWRASGGIDLGALGTDWKWRPVGPNPFEQEQT